MVKSKELSKVLKKVIEELDKYPEVEVRLGEVLHPDFDEELLDLTAFFKKSLNIIVLEIKE